MALGLFEVLEREMRIRNYSPRTIESYRRAIVDLYRFSKVPPRDLAREQIIAFFDKKQKQGLSSQSISLLMNAVNFFLYPLDFCVPFFACRRTVSATYLWQWFSHCLT